ncbi:MAG: glycosyltransferase family 2 protein [Verrucomicrobiota bacterium]
MIHARVCLQCPIYNEPDVIEELLDRVSGIKWPDAYLEIQILDDSDDETTERIERWIGRHPSQARNIIHVRRRERRKGYKAGSLAHGLTLTDAEFIGIFDADFRPEVDFLHQLMPRFADERVAAVQSRWGFNNRMSSWLSIVQAVLLEPHFFVEQTARSDNELFITFNGTAGIFRRRSIEDAGGWSHDTVTEDFDLSCRIQLRREKILYVPEYSVQSELPPSLTAFKAQQFRWTKGTVQTFRKHMLGIFRSDQPLRVKLESLHQLGIGFFHPVLFLATILNAPTFLIQTTTPNVPLGVAQLTMSFLTCGSALTYFFMGQYLHHKSFVKAFGMLMISPLLLSVSMAMCLTTGLASARGAFENGGEFVRTPKGKLAHNASLLWKKSAQLDFLLPLAGEIIIGTGLATFSIFLYSTGRPISGTLFGMQSFGLVLFASTTIQERYLSRKSRSSSFSTNAKSKELAKA